MADANESKPQPIHVPKPPTPDISKAKATAPPTSAKPGNLSPGTSKVPTTQSTLRPGPAVSQQQGEEEKKRQEEARRQEQENQQDERTDPTGGPQGNIDPNPPEPSGGSGPALKPARPDVTHNRPNMPQGDPANSGAVTNSVTPMVPAHGTPRFQVGDIDLNDQAAVQSKLDQFVQLVPVMGGAYKTKGVCLKCGWQSHQYNEQDARDAVKSHAQKHLREVV